MAFQIRCSQCGNSLLLDESQVASVICCPSCGQAVVVEPPVEPPRESVDDLIAQATGSTLVLSDAEIESPPSLGESPVAAPSEAAAEQSGGLSFAEPPGGASPPVPEAAPAASSAEPMPWDAPPQAGEELSAGISVFGETAATAVAAEPEPAPAATPSAESEPTPDWLPAPDAAGPAVSAGLELDFTSAALSTAPAAIQSGVEPPHSKATPASASVGDNAPTESFFPGSAAVKEEDATAIFLESPGEEQFAATTTTPAVTAPAAATRAARAAAPKSPFQIGVLVTVYICGMIAGYVVARFVGAGRPRSSGPSLEYIRDDGDRQKKARWVSPNAEVPRDQLKPLGKTVSLPHLAVTALGVERRKVTLVRDDPFTKASERQATEQECLVLRLVVRNQSTDLEFAPMDEAFVRPTERPMYSYIQLEDGSEIPLYKLARFSEYRIEGQTFDVLKPGQESETIMVAREGSPALAKGKMVWRVQLRAGMTKDRSGADQSYSTVVAFEFTPDKIRAADASGS
jgi:DNA-directed RNA polymerase subunit RPC12/RpoP